MLAIKKILVPVDFSDCSRAAFKQAAYYGEHFAAQVTVLHVWEPPHYVIPETTVHVPGEPKQTMADFARAEARKEMDKLIEELSEGGSFSVEGRLESGNPTETILDVASGYDLIVMGTNGRTGISHILLGSVAEKVVRRAPCPVLTIRAEPEGS